MRCNLLFFLTLDIPVPCRHGIMTIDGFAVMPWKSNEALRRFQAYQLNRRF
ncbi:hypothetical protein TanjilG_03535 [Lupinus angustifolius]|uniref:Uncharacterized protein n=1 Tax=Lupinus angustifolius TaxID=3871 RepID=A0A394DE66_LUPAN|nr:hypothetical protein TanjilG_03535 [Lupinus angustifolius]